MSDIQSQLAPGWSPVNIGLTVVLFLVAWPLGVLMIGYILLGKSLGVSLAEPSTFGQLWRRLGRAWSAATAAFRGESGRSYQQVDQRTAGGTPQSTSRDAQKLAEEREALARERAAFEAEKKARDESDTVN